MSGCAEPTDDSAVSAGAALSGTYPIVFQSRLAGEETGALYLLDPSSGERRLLTPEPGDYRYPRWSPDGTRVVFRDRSDGTSADLVLINADGSGRVAITQGEPPTSAERAPAWSADGQRIAFSSVRETPPAEQVMQLWVTTPVGTAPAPLLPQVAGWHLDVAWSPTVPSQIAFGKGTGAAASDVWLADVERGSEGVALTHGRVYGTTCPAWSPDGSRLAFDGYPVGPDGMIEGLGDHGNMGEGGAPDSELFVVDVASGSFTRLTDNAAEDRTMSWTSDGQSLLFMSDRDGDEDLWLMALDSPEAARNLIDDNSDPHDDSMPHWFAGPR